VPPPPPRRHDRLGSDVERLSRLLSETKRQLSACETALSNSTHAAQELATQLRDLQMEHETALSDLDTTRERADLLEIRVVNLQADLHSQREESRRAREQAAEREKRSMEERRERLAVEALASEMQIQNHHLEDRVNQLEREILEIEDAEARKADETAALDLERTTEQAVDSTLGRALSLLKKENQRLNDLLHAADERAKAAHASVRELERRLLQSGEVSKLRQIHLNDLHAKIQTEREVWGQLQKVEQQYLVRQHQALADKVKQGAAREAEMRSSLNEFVRDFRAHVLGTHNAGGNRQHDASHATTSANEPAQVAGTRGARSSESKGTGRGSSGQPP